MSEIRLAIEVGTQNVFASAVDWPGWSRSGKKTPTAAIEALLSYRERYAAVLVLAGGVDAPGGSPEVIAEVEGDGATDFGVPGRVLEVDHAPIAGPDLERHVALLEAAWAFFDRVAARVSPTLRKGPRGGGRDRDPMIEHVLRSEAGYARYLGLRLPALDVGNGSGVDDQRTTITAALREHGPAGAVAGKKWPVRYIIRRMAWHVLDHAWEMEDKDLTGEAAA